MATKKDDVVYTWYLIEKNNETIKVKVPSSWKVTFGPFTPGSKGYDSGKPCLRFYEANDKQRAVFTDVRSFRDLSIELVKKVIDIKKEASAHITDKTVKQAERVEREERWTTETV